MSNTIIKTIKGSILDNNLAEGIAIIIPPGLNALKVDGKMFYHQMTSSFPVDEFTVKEVNSSRGKLKHILYINTAESSIIDITSMQNLIYQILNTFRTKSIKSVAMNGIYCNNLPNKKIGSEKYHWQIIQEYLLLYPDVFDEILLVDLRGGFNNILG